MFKPDPVIDTGIVHETIDSAKLRSDLLHLS